MRDTTPIFIIGSGRSGTRMLYKLLSGIDHIESYHEYACTHIQPIAAKYYMGLISKKQASEAFKKLHGAEIYYSPAKIWVDSSNKLSWLIEPILDVFPKAKFIHVVRDGRKVVSSFYHKLAPEIYDDVSVGIMQAWLRDREKLPEPSIDKKYWWNIPQKRQPFYKEFPHFNQLERICYHWTECLRVIEESLKNVPKNQQYTVALEELTSKKSVLKKFLSYFEIQYEEHFYEFVKTPKNVFFPMDMILTAEEMKTFNKICGKTMKKYGYDTKKLYKMTY